MAGNLGTLGSLYVDLSANTASFETDIGRAARLADKKAKEIDRQFAAVEKAITRSLGVIATTTAAVVLATNEIVQGIANYKGLSEQIGDTAQAVASLKPVSDVSGVALDTIAGASVKLTAALSKQSEESGGAAAAIKALGLDFQSFQQLAPVAQMEALAAQFALFEDNANKTAAAVALFGKSGAELIPFLNDLAERGERQVVLTQQQIDQADEYAKRLDRLKGEVGTLAQQYASVLTPALDAAVMAAQGMLDAFKQNAELRDQIIAFGRGSALALAIIAESAVAVGKAFLAIGSSARVVLADIEVLGQTLQTSFYLGMNDSENAQLAGLFEKRAKIIQDSTKQWSELWTYNGTALSDAVRASFDQENAAVEQAVSKRTSLAFKALAAPKNAADAKPKTGPMQDAAIKDVLREIEQRDRMMEAAKRDRERLAESLSRQYGPASVGGAAGENARFAAELDAFEQSREEIIARGDDYYALMAEAARAHQDELTRIEQAGVDARAALMQTQLNVASTVFGGVADLASVFGAKAFKAYKAFAIAEAITSTISGAIGAFTQASKTLPPPAGQILGAAAAAGVTASGLAQVARIRATNIGSRRYGGPVSAGGVYEVAEPGNPELLKYGNKTILAMGSQPGTVIPAKAMSAQAAAAGGRGAGNVSIVVNNTAGDLVGARARSARGLNGEQVIELVVAELDDNAGPISRAMTRKTGMRGRGAIG